MDKNQPGTEKDIDYYDRSSSSSRPPRTWRALNRKGIGMSTQPAPRLRGDMETFEDTGLNPPAPQQPVPPPPPQSIPSGSSNQEESQGHSLWRDRFEVEDDDDDDDDDDDSESEDFGNGVN